MLMTSLPLFLIAHDTYRLISLSLLSKLILAKAAPSSAIRLSDEKYFEQGLDDFVSCYFERSPQSIVMTDASSSSSPMSSSITLTAASLSSEASSSSVDDHDQEHDFRRELEEFDHILLNEFYTNSFIPQNRFEISEASREKEQLANAALSSSTDYLEREFRKELEDFDHLLSDEYLLDTTSPMNPYELAEAEGEKEALQDRLTILLVRNDDLEQEMHVVKSDLSELTAVNQKLGIERDTLRRIVCNLSGVISHGLDISPPKLSSVDLEYFIDCMISSLVSKKSQLQSSVQITPTQVL